MRKKRMDSEEGLSILIVDDDVALLDSVSQTLGSQGFNCVTNSAPEKTVELVKEGTVDILIIDYIMVELTGLQIVKQIREFDNDIYIILLTTHVNLMPATQALKNYDIDSYSEKSANFSDLIEKVIIAEKTVKKYQKSYSNISIDNFPMNLKRLRCKQDLTQDEFAQVIGVTRSTIASYENGINHPSIKQIHKLADHFGVSIDYLLGKDVK